MSEPLSGPVESSPWLSALSQRDALFNILGAVLTALLAFAALWMLFAFLW